MRCFMFALLLACAPSTSFALIALPEPQFRLVDAWILPTERTVDPAAIRFNANTDVLARAEETMLLGQLSFQSGGPNASYVFTARMEVTGADNVPRMVDFTSELPMIGIAAGPVNAQGLFFGMMPLSTVAVDGVPYALNLHGVSETPDNKDVQPLIGAMNGDDATTGYLWGNITADPSATNGPFENWDDVIFQTTGGQNEHHCHQTPEPSTWLLAGVAVCGVVGYSYLKRRRVVAAS